MKEPGEVFTPKDYAEWLVNEMRNEITCHCDDLEQAKQCALIAVRSVMDSTRMLINHYIRSNGTKAYMDIELSKTLTVGYWQEVMKEIDKL